MNKAMDFGKKYGIWIGGAVLVGVVGVVVYLLNKEDEFVFLEETSPEQDEVASSEEAIVSE